MDTGTAPKPEVHHKSHQRFCEELYHLRRLCLVDRYLAKIGWAVLLSVVFLISLAAVL